jgi:hypothetical protein
VELSLLLRDSYDMIVAKLPKKTREALSGARPSVRKAPSKKSAKKKTRRSR